MKTIKVSEASGAVLDWLVATADGLKFYDGWQGRWNDEDVTDWFYDAREKAIIQKWFDGSASRAGMWREQARWSPSTDPAQAWPIIDRELIGTTHLVHGFRGPTWSARIGGGSSEYGPTSLIAAMRCYVACKLGETVEVPEELVS